MLYKKKTENRDGISKTTTKSLLHIWFLLKLKTKQKRFISQSLRKNCMSLQKKNFEKKDTDF
jgi:hypothetical protein